MADPGIGVQGGQRSGGAEGPSMVAEVDLSSPQQVGLVTITRWDDILLGVLIVIVVVGYLFWWGSL